MDENLSSEIIPFPGRFRQPVDATARLDRAIRALDQACDELRENVSSWRAGINALTINLGKISENLQSLDNGLAAASSQLQRGGKEEIEAEP